MLSPGADPIPDLLRIAEKMDMASKLVPSAVANGYSTRFLRNIALGETVVQISGSACTDAYSVCPGDPPAPPG